jgi:hypothetical protein
METKGCEHCGETFERPKGLANRVWEARRFCSHKCGHAGKTYAKGERHGSWRGGRTVDPSGYVRVRMPDDHPFVEMRLAHGYVQEHRLVMAESLGRALRPDESVHHKNGDRADNRIENLELRSGQHGRGAAMCCAACGSTDLIPLPI